jgi:hypothetical protein
MAKKQVIDVPTDIIEDDNVPAETVMVIDFSEQPEIVKDIEDIIEETIKFVTPEIQTTYLKASLSTTVNIKSEGTEDSEKYPMVASGLVRIVVFPNETVYVPVSDIPEETEYSLEIFKRIENVYQLVSDKLVDGCVVVKSISDTPSAIVSESIIAVLKVSK